MRMPCYGCIVHRSPAPHNTSRRIICAGNRCLRVALRHALPLMPALLARGDEFRMDPWRNFREFDFPRTRVNKGKKKDRSYYDVPVLPSVIRLLGAYDNNYARAPRELR